MECISTKPQHYIWTIAIKDSDNGETLMVMFDPTHTPHPSACARTEKKYCYVIPPLACHSDVYTWSTSIISKWPMDNTMPSISWCIHGPSRLDCSSRWLGGRNSTLSVVNLPPITPSVILCTCKGNCKSGLTRLKGPQIRQRLAGDPNFSLIK